MTKEQLRQKIVDGIDRALDHPWLAGLTREDRVALSAARAVIGTDDYFVDRVLAAMGPVRPEGVEHEIEPTIPKET